jgi:signal transduction histidine kinase
MNPTVSTHPAARTPAANPVTRVLRQLGVDSAYALVGLPLAIVAFTLVVTGFALGVGLLITVVGFPILVGMVYLARGFAHVERARIPTVLRQPRVTPIYKSPGPDAGFWRRMFTPLSDVQSWLDALHAVVRLPVAVASFSVVVTWWATALGGLTMPLWDWSIPRGADNTDLPELLGLGDDTRTRLLFYAAVGLFAALTLPFVVRAFALLEAGLARVMLTGVAELRAQVVDLSRGQAAAQGRTAAAVAAESTALRRLERDIHDGPQQRLVRLAVDLGRAQQQLDSDPEAARATMAEALSQTREALGELRTLSRGIAPPILVDRGLVAAVSALAARCTVPVDLDLADLPRVDAAAEQAAYFVVAEALTNVAKHSQASACRVSVRHEAGSANPAGEVGARRLEVWVADDGVGGAHVAKGHGLAGLADRVHAAGGELRVSSPPGGPTELYAVLPCGAPA